MLKNGRLLCQNKNPFKIKDAISAKMYDVV